MESARCIRMKKSTSLLLAGSVFAATLYAQDPPVPVETERTVTETVTPDGKKVVEETVVEKPAIAPPPAFDPRRQLSIVPRAVEVEPVPPGTRTETTETTTTRVGARVYHTERNVVVVEGRELPYVTIPVLFVKETAELLDAESRAALDQTAAAIRDVIKADPGATFDIEGHTSTDGADDFNLTLSSQRAKRVYDELTGRYEIPKSVLSAHGYGEQYPMYPNGNEAQMTLDRRVLVVRVK
jgi:outer membrane protein OmpA-like peptidoglycan-associated protein